MPLDLHKLRHLVAVADEGGFTRAAASLHMSQQALSTSIRVLERQVGVPLLERGRSAVRPLPAGEALIEDARALLGAAQAAMDRARRTGRGERRPLRIGHTPAVTGDEVGDLLAPARIDDPGLVAVVQQVHPADLAAQPRDGRLDLGLCRNMPPGTGVDRTLLTRHRLRVAVPSDHPLAGRAEIGLAELRDTVLVVWGAPGSAGYTDLLLEHCRSAGFTPRIERSPVQGTPPITAVVRSGHAAFVTRPAGTAVDGRVEVLDVVPPIHAPVHALWAGALRHEARDALLELLTAPRDG